MSLLLSTILISTLIIIYYLMVRIFVVLFRLTGLTKEKAHFQVISLLTNSGFTTHESELITNNHSRRRIAKFAMITGTVFNVFIASMFINILISINSSDHLESFTIIGVASGVLIVLMILLKIPFISRNIDKLVENIALKIREKNHHENVVSELDAYGTRSIVEVYISKLPEILVNKTIIEAEFKSKYNIIVMLIQRNGRTVDVKPTTTLQNRDKLVLFGKTNVIKELFDVPVKEEDNVIIDSQINNISILDTYGNNYLVEVIVKKIPSILKNKTLGESNLKSDFDINVLVIKRNNKSQLVNAETKIEANDKLVLIGPLNHIKTLFKNDK